MPLSDEPPSSPLAPGPGATLEQSLKHYKEQYEALEADLAEFQASSKDLEAELERDIEASEKRERQLKEKAEGLQYEVDEWKTKYKQAKSEANVAQNALQREITELRDTNRSLQMRLRDIEVANDDYERQQRNTESSLEDMESKYNQTIERSVMLDEEVRTGEQEREALRIEAQRLRDEFSDLKIETDITREKLRKAEEALESRRKPLRLDGIPPAISPRSELSPTNTTTSSPSFDTPPAKTASSSGFSDTPTPPSPPVSEKSAPTSRQFITPSIPRTRISMNTNNTTPRPSTYNSKVTPHTRGPSIAINSRTAPSSSFRQSMSKPGGISQRQPGLPQSTSIMQLRSLRSKMQNLESRVANARSKLPGPVETPPRASPRSGSALGTPIPSSVTVRSNRKRTGGSTVSDTGSIPDRGRATPSTQKSKPSRPSIGQQPPTPIRGEMLPPRPASRSSVSSRSSFIPGHSRPGSRASISGLRTHYGNGGFAPNASTDRVRPKSALSNHGYDGIVDGENDENQEITDFATPTPRRTTIGKRVSDVGSAIPSPTKRLSVGGASKLPAPATRRQSSGLGKTVENAGEMRPPSRVGGTELKNVEESYDVNETF